MEAQFTISSIVFIVLIIVPGVFFKRFYFQGQFSKQFGAGLFADRLITSIFWGIFVQIVTFLVFSRSLSISFDTVKKPIGKAYDALSRNTIPDFSVDNLWYSLSYIAASIIIAAFLGTLFHKTVRFFKLDIKVQVFRFANQWNYYFRGDILNTTDFQSKKGKVLSTVVDLVTDNGDGNTKMFTGFLTQYSISSRTGELETIYLTEAKRYSTTGTAFKEIPGDCLVIPYSRVINMNLRYNFKIIDRAERNKNIQQIILKTGFLGFLLILVYPWFLDIEIVRTALGVLLGFTGWTCLMALVLSFFEHQQKAQLKGWAFAITFILFLIFTISSLYSLRVFPRLFNIISF